MAIDYEVVIADLEARRTAFNQAIDQAVTAIRHILTATGGTLPNGYPLPTGQVVNNDTDFFGLSLIDAAKKLLRKTRRKMNNREIADALEKGGFVHTSKEFVNTVGTALWRAEKDGDTEIFRQGRYWLLSEWAPGRRRGIALKGIPADADAGNEFEEAPPQE